MSPFVIVGLTRVGVGNLEEQPDSWKRAPEDRTVHPDCINASNPYHDCSEYCFKKIADANAGKALPLSFIFEHN
jgi:hypothetical protein